MSYRHSDLVSYLKALVARDTPLKQLAELSNEDFARQVFYNYRGGRGLRLTKMGLKVVGALFKGYDISREAPVTPLELVFLDKKARLPYYVAHKGNMVMFDPDLGLRLKMVEGDISTLMEMEETLSDEPDTPRGTRKFAQKNS